MKKNIFKRIVSFTLIIFTFLNFNTFKLLAKENQDIKLVEISNKGTKNFVNLKLKLSKKYNRRNYELIQNGVNLNNCNFKVYNVYDSFYILTYDNIKIDDDNYAQVSYLIDLHSNKIIEDYKKYQIINSSVIMKWYVENKLFINVKINSDGSLETDNIKFNTLEDYLSYFNKNNISTKGVCELAINLLCGTGGVFACNTLCALTAVASRIGGAACAVICSLIAAKGCDAAKIDICR